MTLTYGVVVETALRLEDEAALLLPDPNVVRNVPDHCRVPRLLTIPSVPPKEGRALITGSNQSQTRQCDHRLIDCLCSYRGSWSGMVVLPISPMVLPPIHVKELSLIVTFRV